MDNLKNILSGLSTEVDQETLLQYLQGKLSDEQRQAVEEKLVDSSFEDDALEGLQEFKDKQQISYIVDVLNRDLKKKVEKKKKRREKLKLKDQSTLYIVILIFILLIVLSYWIIRTMLARQ